MAAKVPACVSPRPHPTGTKFPISSARWPLAAAHTAHPCPRPRPRALFEPAHTCTTATACRNTIGTASHGTNPDLAHNFSDWQSDTQHAARCDLEGLPLPAPVGFCSPSAPSDMPRPNFSSPPPSSLKASRVVAKSPIGALVSGQRAAAAPRAAGQATHGLGPASPTAHQRPHGGGKRGRCGRYRTAA